MVIPSSGDSGYSVFSSNGYKDKGIFLFLILKFIIVPL